MGDRVGAIRFQGQPLTLVGQELQVGDQLPECTLQDTSMSPVSLSSFRGKKLVIATVPSLDTPVCDAEIHRFNTEAAAMGDVAIVAVSMDLPPAQARWCGAAGIDAVTTLSDHLHAAFGQATGLLIKELRLLARAVLVVRPDGNVEYVQLVEEVTQEPDYDAVLKALQAV